VTNWEVFCGHSIDVLTPGDVIVQILQDLRRSFLKFLVCCLWPYSLLKICTPVCFAVGDFDIHTFQSCYKLVWDRWTVVQKAVAYNTAAYNRCSVLHVNIVASFYCQSKITKQENGVEFVQLSGCVQLLHVHCAVIW